MPVFGARSKLHLGEAHPYLQRVLLEAIKHFDYSIIQGYRGREEQEVAFRKGFSKAHFGSSAHNYKPCLGVDCIPYPFKDSEWEDDAIFKTMSDHLFSAAETCRQNGMIPKTNLKTGKPLLFRWGGDWHMDGTKTTNDEWDQPHFELHPWQDYIIKP